METNNLYYHKGQLRSILADANTEYIVCGRGWGKSKARAVSALLIGQIACPGHQSAL
jgi:hypothetical protein